MKIDLYIFEISSEFLLSRMIEKFRVKIHAHENEEKEQNQSRGMIL